MNFAKGFKKFSDGIDKVCIAIVVAMIAAMVCVTIAQIVCRELSTMLDGVKPLQWSEEVCRYLLVWATFLGASSAYKEGSHITITFLQGFFPPKVQRYIRILVHVLCIVAFCAVVYFGFNFAMKQMQLAPSLRIPMKYMYMPVPIGFGLMLIHAVNAVFEELFKSKGGNA